MPPFRSPRQWVPPPTVSVIPNHGCFGRAVGGSEGLAPARALAAECFLGMGSGLSRRGCNARPGMADLDGVPEAGSNRIGGGSGPADAYFPAQANTLSEQAPTIWARGKQITTPFVQVPGLVTAQCIDRGGAQYLALTVHPNPADPRTDQIPGDVVQGGKVALDWGLHLIDINANMGGLVSAAAAQRSKF